METSNNETLEFKCGLFGGGEGKITITEELIIWKKSKINFLNGGLLAFLTKGDKVFPISTILHYNECKSLGGGGLEIYTNNGKKFKFIFNKKQDRDTAMNFLESKKV